jgi:hypothetical protein
MTATFAKLNAYGSYDLGKVPRGYHRVPLDGSVRILKRLGIPHVTEVEIVNAYGNHYFPRTVNYVIRNRDKRRFLAACEARRAANKTMRPHPDLILCLREISRAAHRERDAAEQAYRASRHTLARNSKNRKNQYYALKDRGIAYAYGSGLLRYVGQSPQGLAVYEYADGGMSCFHSTLHPTGVEHKPVEGHPEILEVIAKAKIKGVSLQRVISTLEALPPVNDRFERSAAPRKTGDHPPVVCWECGEEGHISRECPESRQEEIDEAWS